MNTETKPTEQELRELDAWILEHVYGWKRGRSWGNGNGEWIVDGKGYPEAPSWNTSPCPTTDAAAAMQVLEKCAEKLGGEAERACAVEWLPVEEQWQVTETDIADGVRARGKTLEIAICRFAKILFSE